MRKLLILAGLLLAAGWYARAHYTLQDALRYAKTHPSSRLSPAVDYYAGMAYYARERHESAAQAFSQLLADHPTCQYAPNGLLRLGSSYEELRQWPEARAAYEQYLERFPQGAEIDAVRRHYGHIKFHE